MNRATRLLVAGTALVLVSCSASEDTESPTATESSPDRTVTSLTVPDGGTAGRCLPPSAKTLGSAATAFDGEVRSIEGDTVTLDVGAWYRGDPTDVVEVVAPSESLQDLIGAAAFEEGQRFLVAADDRGELLVCGYTAAYGDGLAALYNQAFGG